MKTKTLFILMLGVISALLIAGCTQQQPVQTTTPPTTLPATQKPADTVMTASSSLGTILTDAKGMTLYYFITDIPASGASTCYAAANCSKFWPIFSVDNVVVSPPLNAAAFASITRTDGTKQTTYNGWPLYYFLKDTKPGDVTGENVLKTWYVAKPDYTVMIGSIPHGQFRKDTLLLYQGYIRNKCLHRGMPEFMARLRWGFRGRSIGPEAFRFQHRNPRRRG
jgi:predicted lipoprotein with Yx(FWY)xxD motif